MNPSVNMEKDYRQLILESFNTLDLQKLKTLLSQSPQSINDEDAHGTPVFLYSGYTGNLPIIRYIVEYSMASMNTVDINNRNLLHYASKSGSLEVAKYLVEKVGLSIVSGDSNLITPIDIAYHQHSELLAYFESVIGANYSDLYRNPIRRGFFPDPSIVRVGNDYYMVNSSFIYFPCIPVSHSTDLINWKIIGYAITNPEWANIDTLEGGRGYWAPDISFYKGRFYITATYRMNDDGPIYRKQIIVSSNHAQGPYSKPVIIDEDGIDPSIFNDSDGRRYLLLNRGGRIMELNEDATQVISEAELLYYGYQKRAPEGPHLLKKDGYYYLFLAEGGTGLGHRITVARSKTLKGNYEPCPYNPIMRQEIESEPIQRCGHGKPFETQNGDWFMVYLCGRSSSSYTFLGRETALDPINWTPDGWPIVNNLNGPSVLQKRPKLDTFSNDEDSFLDDFTSSTLELEWMFPRPPELNGYYFKDNMLYLKASKVALSSPLARNILLRRQSHFNFTVETKLNFENLHKGQESGLIAYYDENSWFTFAAFIDENNNNILRCVEHVGKESRYILPIDSRDYIHLDRVITNASSVEPKTLWLRIISNGLERELYYSKDGQIFHYYRTLRNVYYLADEGLPIGKRFTGSMVGLFAYSGNQDTYVSFDYFKYQGQDNYTF